MAEMRLLTTNKILEAPNEPNDIRCNKNELKTYEQATTEVSLYSFMLSYSFRMKAWQNDREEGVHELRSYRSRDRCSLLIFDFLSFHIYDLTV